MNHYSSNGYQFGRLLSMRRMQWLMIMPLLALFLSACNQQSAPTLQNSELNLSNQISGTQTATETMNTKPDSPSSDELLNLNEAEQIQATIKTNMGDIVIKLRPDVAPKTVANFVGLAEGTKPWQDPVTGEWMEGQPLYNGVIFHRVIKDFMIQGGDPMGNGMGGPGYKFEDEIDPSLTFDKAGLLAMANAGPNTNGSQFFITHAATPWLNGNHTIFGEVVSGMDVVDTIANVETDSRDKPVEDVVIESIEIERL